MARQSPRISEIWPGLKLTCPHICCSPPSRRGVGETFRRPDTAPLRPVTRGDEGSERGFYSDILGTHEQHEAGDSGTQGYLQVSTVAVAGRDLSVMLACNARHVTAESPSLNKAVDL